MTETTNYNYLSSKIPNSARRSSRGTSRGNTSTGGGLEDKPDTQPQATTQTGAVPQLPARNPAYLNDSEYNALMKYTDRLQNESLDSLIQEIHNTKFSSDSKENAIIKNTIKDNLRNYYYLD